jgi:hypothetical protein
MYSEEKRVSQKGDKTNPVTLTTHEGIIEFYNSLVDGKEKHFKK